MIASDLDYFDPLSETFQQSIQLNEYANLASSYNSTPRFYNLNLTLDILNEGNQNNLDTNNPSSREVDLAAISLKIDPRSKSGTHNISPQPNINSPNSRIIKGNASPLNKKPFSFTIYKDSNENDKIKITKMGRFSITKTCHNDEVNVNNLDSNIHQGIAPNLPQTKGDAPIQNDLIMIC